MSNCSKNGYISDHISLFEKGYEIRSYILKWDIYPDIYILGSRSGTSLQDWSIFWSWQYLTFWVLPGPLLQQAGEASLSRNTPHLFFSFSSFYDTRVPFFEKRLNSSPLFYYKRLPKNAKLGSSLRKNK